MQYPLVLVAAFATASIAAPDACPPASTQGKEDVAKEVGKLAKKICPPSRVLQTGPGYELFQADCERLLDECSKGGITEEAELHKCITETHIFEVKNPAQSTKTPKEKACPHVQYIPTGPGYTLQQAECKLLVDECSQGGITEEAALRICAIDKYLSKVRASKNPAQSTEKPAKAA